MKELLHSARALLRDAAGLLLFGALYTLTHNLLLSVAAGLALALGMIGWEMWRGRKIDALQWIGLVVTASSGSAALVADNPLWVMLQPSVMYCLVGAAMLQHGWMLKYLPQRAILHVGDLGMVFGYVWAGLMFFSAALNLVLAQRLSVSQWVAFMSIYATASKAALFLGQYAVMKMIGKRRRYARQNALAA
ncbi:MAG: septation protein IspZ [Alphaproteobacteria bacterium]